MMEKEEEAPPAEQEQEQEGVQQEEEVVMVMVEEEEEKERKEEVAAAVEATQLQQKQLLMRQLGRARHRERKNSLRLSPAHRSTGLLRSGAGSHSSSSLSPTYPARLQQQQQQQQQAAMMINNNISSPVFVTRSLDEGMGKMVGTNGEGGIAASPTANSGLTKKAEEAITPPIVIRRSLQQKEQELFDVALVKRRVTPKTASLTEPSSQTRGQRVFIRALLFPLHISWWTRRRIPKSLLYVSSVLYFLHFLTSFRFYVAHEKARASLSVNSLEMATPFILLFLVAVLVAQAAAATPIGYYPTSSTISSSTSTEEKHSKTATISRPSPILLSENSSTITNQAEERNAPLPPSNSSPLISPNGGHMAGRRKRRGSEDFVIESENDDDLGSSEEGDILSEEDESHMGTPQSRPGQPPPSLLFREKVNLGRSGYSEKDESPVEVVDDDYDDDDDDDSASEVRKRPLNTRGIFGGNEASSSSNGSVIQSVLRRFQSDIPTPTPTRPSGPASGAKLERNTSNLSEADGLLGLVRGQSMDDVLHPIKSVHWSAEGPQKVQMSLADIRNAIEQKVSSTRVDDDYRLIAYAGTILTTLVPLSYRCVTQSPPIMCWLEATMRSMPFPLLVLIDNAVYLWLAFVDRLSGNIISDVPTMSEDDFRNSFHLYLERDLAMRCALASSPPGSDANQCVSTKSGNLIEIIGLFLTSVLGSSLYSVFVVLVCTLSTGILSFILFQAIANAEDAFRRRLFYAKYFGKLTSSRRSKKAGLPHFRLYKVEHIKVWLSLRSRRTEGDLNTLGPYKGSDTTANILVWTAMCLITVVSMRSLGALLGEDDEGQPFDVVLHNILFAHMYDWFFFVWAVFLGIFTLRITTLASKTHRKYENTSVLLTEQLNVFMKILRKPHRKDELAVCNNMLKVAIKLLQNLEGSGKKNGQTGALLSPFVFNLLRVILLSGFGTVSGRIFGFKVRMWKL